MIHQYQVIQSFLNQVVMNVLYYDHAAEDDGIKQEIADALRAAWASNLTAVMSSSWSLTEVRVRNVSLAGTLSQTFVPTLGTLVGTASGQLVPTQSALLVVTIGPSVKPNRTRTYLGGFTISAMNGGLITAGVVTNAINWGNAVKSLVTATEGTFLRQSVEWVGPPMVVGDANPVSTVRVFNIPATQRRRRIGVGA